MVLLCTHLHIILLYFIYLPVNFRFPLSPFPPHIFSPHFSHFHFSQSLRLYTSILRSSSILQQAEHSALHELLLQRKPNHSGVSSTGFKQIRFVRKASDFRFSKVQLVLSAQATTLILVLYALGYMEFFPSN
ncbi:hypothetical protein I3843_06G070100 [Carya illinoinensis]|nr:hypothetical protein I3843_06G070100 [Carya illinoinensis]